jgi:hypothetical protein
MSHRSSKSKNKKIGNMILAFLLFLAIAVLSLSTCARIVIANPNTIADIFTDKEYVNSLYLDIKQYAYDECEKSSVPTDGIDDAVNYDVIYNIEASYICYALGTSNSYNTQAFDDNIASFKENISSDMQNSLTTQGIKFNKNDVETFAQNISDYAQNKAQFKYLDKLETAVNLAKTMSLVFVVLSAIITLTLALILFFTASKRYRGLRNITYSLEASAVFDFVMVLAVAIVKATKELVIYPTYLCASVMNYVNSCMQTVALAGVVLFFTALVLMTIIWKLKRDED